MRNVFHQYTQPENRLTHALASALAEDDRLLKRFIRWVTGKSAPKKRLRIVEQQRPGEPVREETEATGLPDCWIYDDERWSLIIESKIASPLSTGQLRRHLATAARWGFVDPILLTITAHEEVLRFKGRTVSRTWTELYSWMLQERARSEWAGRLAEYMEVLEADLIEKKYLKEGAVTSFSGIHFDTENPYNYLEAKRLLKLALVELRRSTRLVRVLGMDPDSPGRGAITGRESTAVWDFLRLKESRSEALFTKYPHLTFAIETDRALAIITVPHGIRSEFRRRLLDLGREGFNDVLQDVARNILAGLKGDTGAAPVIIAVQRRYPTQRSSAIVDARLEFDLRTAFPLSHGRRSSAVKFQPEWVDATFRALAKKNSNFQVAIGAIFPYGRSSSVSERLLIDRVAATWLGCKPLLDAMGIGNTRRKGMAG